MKYKVWDRIPLQSIVRLRTSAENHTVTARSKRPYTTIERDTHITYYYAYQLDGGSQWVSGVDLV